MASIKFKENTTTWHYEQTESVMAPKFLVVNRLITNKTNIKSDILEELMNGYFDKNTLKTIKDVSDVIRKRLKLRKRDAYINMMECVDHLNGIYDRLQKLDGDYESIPLISGGGRLKMLVSKVHSKHLKKLIGLMSDYVTSLKDR